MSDIDKKTVSVAVLHKEATVSQEDRKRIDTRIAELKKNKESETLKASALGLAIQELLEQEPPMTEDEYKRIDAILDKQDQREKDGKLRFVNSLEQLLK